MTDSPLPEQPAQTSPESAASPPVEGATPSSDPLSRARPQRKLRVLDPLIQVRLGLYNVVLSVALCASLLGILHAQWLRARVVIDATSPNAKTLLSNELSNLLYGSMFWAGGTLAIFVVAIVLVSVMATHRLVGPTIAFRRHLRALIEGDYDAQTTLRPNDAFGGVADDLNELSRVLRERQGPSSEG